VNGLGHELEPTSSFTCGSAGFYQYAPNDTPVPQTRLDRRAFEGQMS
jgi:hypothetical protein